MLSRLLGYERTDTQNLVCESELSRKVFTL